MEPAIRPRIAIKYVGDQSQTYHSPGSFPYDPPFDFGDHFEAIINLSRQKPSKSKASIRVIILTSQQLTSTLSVGEFSEARIHFPRGTEGHVQEVLNHPSLAAAVFIPAELLMSSVIVSTEFELRHEFRLSFLRKNPQTTITSQLPHTTNAETGNGIEGWDVYTLHFAGELWLERLSNNKLLGRFEVDEKQFLLRFLIQGDKLTSFEYGGEGLTDRVKSCSFFFSDNEGTSQTDTDYYFGELKDGNPHGSSNCDSTHKTTLYDGVFHNGKALMGLVPEGFAVPSSADISNLYEGISRNQWSDESTELQTQVIMGVPNKMEGVLTRMNTLHIACFYNQDGGVTEGFFESLENKCLGEGVIKDKFGKVVVNEILFETAAKSYLSLTVVRVGGGHLSPEQEQFVDSAVRLCNKLAFPYEEDYEPPRSAHQLSEEEFEAWTGKVSTGSEPKIVHVVLLPECSTSRKHLEHLAQRLAETDTLIVSDFCSEQTKKWFYKGLSQKIIALVYQSNLKFVVYFCENELEMQLSKLNESCLLVRIESLKSAVEATLCKGRILTTNRIPNKL